MPLKLYLDYISQPCRAILIFARLNNIQFEEKIVSVAKGGTGTDEFAKVNPMKCVPALDDDGFVLTESIAILRYLLAQSGVEDYWYPRDKKQRARVDEYIAWQHTGIRASGCFFFMAKALFPYMKNQPLDKSQLAQRSQAFEKSLNLMENYFLKSGTFMAGKEFTLADLLAICEIMQPISTGYDITKGRPKLAAWFDTVKDRLQPHFDEVHEEIMKFAKPYYSQ